MLKKVETLSSCKYSPCKSGVHVSSWGRMGDLKQSQINSNRVNAQISHRTEGIPSYYLPPPFSCSLNLGKTFALVQGSQGQVQQSWVLPRPIPSPHAPPRDSRACGSLSQSYRGF